MKKVSILIPTYNQSAYLSEAITSALKQTYKNLEVIVSDDGSTDNTSKVVKQFLVDTRLKYFRNDNNIGRVKNYRKGLFDLATGDYFLNLDADDYLTSPNFVEDAVKILEGYPDIGFVMANAYILHDGEASPIAFLDNIKIDRIFMEGELVNSFFKGEQFFYHLTSIYRRTAALNLNFYSIDSVWSDGLSLFSLACNSKVAVSFDKVGIWRIHGKNESKSFYLNANYEDIFEVVDKIENFSSKIDNRAANYFRYINSYDYIVYLLKNSKLVRLFGFIKFMLINKPKVLFLYSPMIFLRVMQNSLKYFIRSLKHLN